MKTAVIMSEDAAWTTPLDAGYEKCLPKIGLKVLDHIRFSPDTTDFTPIFNKIEGAEARRDHHRHLACRHAADGAVEEPAGADPDVRHLLAGDQLDLLEGHQRRHRGRALSRASPVRASRSRRRRCRSSRRSRRSSATCPSYSGYTAYDEVYYIADAIKRAGSTDSDKLVDAMEKTDYVGTIGRVQFMPQGRAASRTALKTGPGFITGLMLQWQDGKQVNMWPANLANGKLNSRPSSRSRLGE